MMEVSAEGWLRYELPIGYAPSSLHPRRSEMAIEKQCAHGKDYDARCIDCELVWYRECLQDAARRVQSCTEMIAKLERERDD